jgi:ribosomal protein S18 acetylase RimI-like enzyme
MSKDRFEPFSIASATTDDCPDCAALLLDQLREHGVEGSSERLHEILTKAVASPASGFLLVARERERAIGVAYVAIILSVEHCGPVAWLEELYVDPDHRCRGIGTALLNSVVARLMATGAVAIDLEVDESHGRAVSLYRRLGFRPLARSRWVRGLANETTLS